MSKGSKKAKAKKASKLAEEAEPAEAEDLSAAGSESEEPSAEEPEDEGSSEGEAEAEEASDEESSAQGPKTKESSAKREPAAKKRGKKELADLRPKASDAASEEELAEERWERTKSNFKTIGGAILLALFIRIVLFEAFEIDGPSMEPTLLNGDRVVVAKFLYGLFLPFTDEAALTWGLPNVGDVVIVRSPLDNIDIVKRVIGVPGDRIEVRDDVPYVNGRAIHHEVAGPCNEGAASEDPTDCEWVEEGRGGRTWLTSHSIVSLPRNHPAQVVPPGHIYVLGDHRDRSNDSRNPRVGMIPASRVKGRALAIYWSNEDGVDVRWDRIFESVR